MFRRAILVDYENVVNEGLAYVDRLSEDNKVVIFYSKNANSMTFQTHQKLMDSKATIEYMEVTVGGRNALDIQLATYLGYLAGKSEAEEYYMISKDNGFRHVETFCEQKLHLNISCKPYIGKYFLDDEKEELNQTEEGMKTEENTPKEQTELVNVKETEEAEPTNIIKEEPESAPVAEEETEQETLEVTNAVKEEIKEPESRNSIEEETEEPKSVNLKEEPEKAAAVPMETFSLAVTPKAEVFIFNGTGFTKEDDIKKERQEIKEIQKIKDTEKDVVLEMVQQENVSETETAKSEDALPQIKETETEEKADVLKDKIDKEKTDKEKTDKEDREDITTEALITIEKTESAKDSLEQVKAEDEKEMDSAKTKKKRKKKQNTEQKESEQNDAKEEAVKPQKAKKKALVIVDEKALENAIQEAFETYRDKKLKTEVMMNFIKTGQKKALYNMLRGKLGQTEGQKVYNTLKQYMEEIA